MAGVALEADDEQNQKMGLADHDEAVRIGKVIVVSSQHTPILADCPGEYASVGGGQEPYITGRHDVMPRRLESGGQTRTAEILVDQNHHERRGRSRPRAWMSAAS